VGGGELLLNEFDGIPIWITQKGNVLGGRSVRGSRRHGAGIARDRDSFAGEQFTGRNHVPASQRDVTVRIPPGVGMVSPVVCQLQDGGAVLVAVPEEGQGELAVGITFLAKQTHSQMPGVEIQGTVEICDAKHRVQYAARARGGKWFGGIRHVGVLMLVGPGVAADHGGQRPHVARCQPCAAAAPSSSLV
jgi:hypothetical protein